MQNIWEFKAETVFSMALDQDGTLIIGTGDEGNIYRLTGEGKESLLFARDESQITAIHRDEKNRVYMCTSNMGKVLVLNNHFERSGEYNPTFWA